MSGSEIVVLQPTVYTVEVTARGPQGPSQVVAYVHNQGTASATWNITHNLGWNPNVTVQDSAGGIVEGEIAYTNINSLVLTFTSAFSGKAYLS